MLLYHGTNGQWLSNILRKGLEPRGSKVARNNWTHVKHQNNKECVYLTNTYAPYFAMNACRGRKPMCAVLEIDSDKLDKARLFPDEDFLEQANRDAVNPAVKVEGGLSERIIHFRQNMFKFTWVTGDDKAPMWWQASLRYLGTCAYRGVIPPEAITRAVVWPHYPRLKLIWDPTITITNQMVCGPFYTELTRKLMVGEFTDVLTLTDEEKTELRKASIRNPKNAFLPPIPGWAVISRETKT